MDVCNVCMQASRWRKKMLYSSRQVDLPFYLAIKVACAAFPRTIGMDS